MAPVLFFLQRPDQCIGGPCRLQKAGSFGQAHEPPGGIFRSPQACLHFQAQQLGKSLSTVPRSRYFRQKEASLWASQAAQDIPGPGESRIPFGSSSCSSFTVTSSFFRTAWSQPRLPRYCRAKHEAQSVALRQLDNSLKIYNLPEISYK